MQIEEPLSAQRLKAPRYGVTDPYLQFWLRFVEPALQIERLRSERVVDRILTAWPDFRGRTVEPIVRSAVERLLPDERLPGAEYVGSYWTRTNDPEVDLIGADKRLAPAKVAFAGSIKWRRHGFVRLMGPGRLSPRAPRVPRRRPHHAARRCVAYRDRPVRAQAPDGFEPADLLAGYQPN